MYVHTPTSFRYQIIRRNSYYNFIFSSFEAVVSKNDFLHNLHVKIKFIKCDLLESNILYLKCTYILYLVLVHCQLRNFATVLISKLDVGIKQI